MRRTLRVASKHNDDAAAAAANVERGAARHVSDHLPLSLVHVCIAHVAAAALAGRVNTRRGATRRGDAARQKHIFSHGKRLDTPSSPSHARAHASAHNAPVSNPSCRCQPGSGRQRCRTR